MAETFITVRNLVKTYDTPAGPLNILRGINLEICKGDFVALIGPSGSGKTTLRFCREKSWDNSNRSNRV